MRFIRYGVEALLSYLMPSRFPATRCDYCGKVVFCWRHGRKHISDIFPYGIYVCDKCSGEGVFDEVVHEHIGEELGDVVSAWCQIYGVEAPEIERVRA
jgi:hypothetical protein